MSYAEQNEYDIFSSSFAYLSIYTFRMDISTNNFLSLVTIHRLGIAAL